MRHEAMSWVQCGNATLTAEVSFLLCQCKPSFCISSVPFPLLWTYFKLSMITPETCDVPSNCFLSISSVLAVGSGDAAARLTFDKIIQPAAIRFQPNIILISAGYDAHWRDPLEKLNFYSSTYHFLTRRVKQLSNKLCGKAALHMTEFSGCLTFCQSDPQVGKPWLLLSC